MRNLGAANLGVKPTALAGCDKQIGLPQSDGGLAITSTAQMHDCAFVASYLQHLRTKQPFDSYPTCSFNGKRVNDAMRVAVILAADRIRANSHGIGNDVLPVGPFNLISKYIAIGQPARGSKHQFGRKLQAALFKGVHDKQFTELIPDQTVRSKRTARLTSLLLKRTGRWLTAPLTDENLLADDEFAMCVRLRLGLPLINDMPDRCPLCGGDSSDLTGYDHMLYCQSTTKMFTERHDDIVQTLKHIANQFARAKAEPAADHRAVRDTRPDLAVRHAHGTFFTDVKVVHIAAPSYERKAPLSVLRDEAGAKTRKHKRYADLQGGDFHPFVVSTFGTMDISCGKFFDLIRKFAANSNPSDPLAGPKAVGIARATVAVSIQRSVARATLDALKEARLKMSERAELPDRGVNHPPPRAQANAFLNSLLPRAAPARV